MHRKRFSLVMVVCLMLLLVFSAYAVACGSSDNTTTTAATTATTAASPTTAASTATTAASPTTAATTATTAASPTTAASTPPAATGPIKIAVTEGFTGFMSLDAEHLWDGVSVAVQQANNQVAGRPIEVVKGDNASDPVKAVDVARRLVENDKVSVIIGPVFSPSVASITGYLEKTDNPVPLITTMGQVLVNAQTAGGVAFAPFGLLSAQGYELGKYASEVLGYKTVNCISLDDTGGRELQAGFAKGFSEGGGRVMSDQYAPMDNVDWAPYLTTLKTEPADCTYFWIFGSAVQFIKQYRDYDIKAPMITSMAGNLPERVLDEVGDLGLGIIAVDQYANVIDNALNKQFVDAYRAYKNGTYPTMCEYAAWFATKLFLAAVEKNNGDATPATIMKTISTMSMADTPTGPISLSPFLQTFVGTGSIYILKCEKIDGRYTWGLVKTIDNVLKDAKVQ
jgi:branched-chain amino acid transport system substrate-binding protein